MVPELDHLTEARLVEARGHHKVPSKFRCSCCCTGPVRAPDARTRGAGGGQHVQQKTTKGPLREVVDNVVVGAQGHNDNVVPTLDCLGVSESVSQLLSEVITTVEVWVRSGTRETREKRWKFQTCCGTSNNGKTQNPIQCPSRSGKLDPPPWGTFWGGATARQVGASRNVETAGIPHLPSRGIQPPNAAFDAQEPGRAVAGAALQAAGALCALLGQSLASLTEAVDTRHSPSLTTRPPSHTAVALSPESLFFSCFESEAIHSLAGA